MKKLEENMDETQTVFRILCSKIRNGSRKKIVLVQYINQT